MSFVREVSLIGCYYKIIAKILAERVKKVVGNVVGEVQNAFIKGRFILDGVLIANETVDHLKKNRSKGLIFKVDFEKAYDSLNWRFLIDIMKKMRFGDRWCKWVDSCLRSSTMSILVNGSPTNEFCLERGVRQGDPLSHFLFILAAEGLNAIVSEAVEKGVFKGVKIGRNNVVVSHLQYADDTIFFGEWNKENAKVLMCILKCFEEASGLRVNYNKSKLYGVGVSDIQLRDMARWMKCGVGDFPFTDRWRWALHESGDFTVKELTKLVEEKILDVNIEGDATIWNKWVPKKVNIFVWRALKGRLLVREELDKRGIDLDTLLCPSCGDVVESCSFQALCGSGLQVVLNLVFPSVFGRILFLFRVFGRRFSLFFWFWLWSALAQMYTIVSGLLSANLSAIALFI
ncbi:reverse transcriptase domain, reverse transcriptase zinc-binding domain protein [Tanacetum coccineum]